MDIPGEISTLIQVKRRQLCFGIRLKWHTSSKVSNSSKISFGPQALKSIYTSWEMTYRKCATPSQFWITGRNRILHCNVADFNSFWSFQGCKPSTPANLKTFTSESWKTKQRIGREMTQPHSQHLLLKTHSCWKTKVNSTEEFNMPLKADCKKSKLRYIIIT